MNSTILYCGGKVDCSNLNATVTITVLPDIVGIGILVSFFVTCGAVFLLMILGYFRDTLPGDNLTWTDKAFLSRWHFCKSCRVRFGGAHSTTSLDLECKHVDPKVDQRRRKSVEALILTLSDQQLVTGPAMIVAALAQHCEISCYEFQVVASLAYLSATTHLASLLVLRDYFREHQGARNMRAFGMGVNLSLLSYCLVISTASLEVNSSASVQCIMRNTPSSGLANGLIAISFLIVNYIQSLAQLYGQNKLPFKELLRKNCCESDTGPHLTQDQFELWYKREILESRERPGSKARRNFLWQLAIPHGRLSPRTKIRTLYAVVADYRDSFLSELPALFMSASYAITQLVTSRQNRPPISNSENKVDFGQIVPLLMLLLPLMTAIDTYNEAHKGVSAQHESTMEHVGPKLKNQLRNIPAPAYGRGLSDRRWFSIPSDTRRGPIPSGLAVFEDAPRSIGLDPKLFSPYSRHYVMFYLNFLFWGNAAFSIATGALLWTNGLFGLGWSIAQAAALGLQGADYYKWLWSSRQKSRKLRREDLSVQEVMEWEGSPDNAPPSLTRRDGIQWMGQPAEPAASLKADHPPLPIEELGVGRFEYDMDDFRSHHSTEVE